MLSIAKGVLQYSSTPASDVRYNLEMYETYWLLIVFGSCKL